MSDNLYLYQSKLSGFNSVSGNFGLRSAINDNGDTILVGTYRDNNANNTYDGSVYYFSKIDDVFYLNSKITGIRENYAFFGRSVSLNASGDMALIGAYGENINSQDVGAAYLFNKVNNNWILRKKITGSINPNNWFANELVLNENGDIGFISAIDDNRYGQTGAGAVYVYTGIGDGFNYRTTITGTIQSGAYFGTSLSIDKSGNTLIIGAYGENDFSGAAYIYTGNGTSWNLNTKISGNQTSGLFGLSVSIDKNGNYIAIGAPRENEYSGRVFLYKRNGSNWDLKKTFSGNYYDQLGRSLNFNYSGNKLFIGGPTATFRQSFNGYTLIYTGSDENWNLFQTLALGNSSQYNSYFANDIKINKNEETLLVGANAYDINYKGDNAGAVFAFTNQDIKIPKKETSIVSSDDVLFAKNYYFSTYKNVYINYPIDSFGYYNIKTGIFSHPTLGLNNLNYLTGYMSSGTGWYNQYIYFYDRENRPSVATIQIYLYDYSPSLACEDYSYSSNTNLPCDPNRYTVVPVTIQGLSCYRCSGISSSSSETRCEDFGLFSNTNIVCPNGFTSRSVYVNGLICSSCVNVSSSSSSSSSPVPNPPNPPTPISPTPAPTPPTPMPTPSSSSSSSDSSSSSSDSSSSSSSGGGGGGGGGGDGGGPGPDDDNPQCAPCAGYDAGVGAGSSNCTAFTCQANNPGSSLFEWACVAEEVPGYPPCAYPRYTCYKCKRRCYCSDYGYRINFISQCNCPAGKNPYLINVPVSVGDECLNGPGTIICKICGCSSSSVSASVNLDILNTLLEFNTENPDIDFFNDQDVNTEEMQKFIKKLKNK